MSSQASPGEVWLVDLGMAAKVRPSLILSDPPADDELALQVIVPHTTAVRGNRWEFPVSLPFLKRKGAIHLQQIRSIPIAKLERKLGKLPDPVFRKLKLRLIELLSLDQ